MTTRNVLEFVSRNAAGIKETVHHYYWVRVLDRFEMYVLDSDESVSPHLIKDGYWEPWITTWFMNNIEKFDRFWDIGANTGYYSFLAQSMGVDTVAFEPNPTYANMMNMTHGRKDIVLGMTIHEIALSNYNGEATLNIPTMLHGSASLNEIVEGYETTHITVPVRSFDEHVQWVEKDASHLFKIDAEGEEERILQGARKFLDTVKSAVLLLEYTPGAYTPQFLDELFDRWTVYFIDYDGVEMPASPEWVLSQTDWVMLVLR